MASAETNEKAAWSERMERLARLVPGVGAYQDREGLRDTDKWVRTYLAEMLGNVAKDLEPAQRRLVRDRRLDQMPALERLGRQIGTLADRVRFASCGFAGVFALHKIRERELAELHDCDARLLEEIPRLRAAILAVADAVGQAGAFAGAADVAENSNDKKLEIMGFRFEHLNF